MTISPDESCRWRPRSRCSPRPRPRADTKTQPTSHGLQDVTLGSNADEDATRSPTPTEGAASVTSATGYKLTVAGLDGHEDRPDEDLPVDHRQRRRQPASKVGRHRPRQRRRPGRSQVKVSTGKLKGDVEDHAERRAQPPQRGAVRLPVADPVGERPAEEHEGPQAAVDARVRRPALGAALAARGDRHEPDLHERLHREGRGEHVQPLVERLDARRSSTASRRTR